MTTYMAKPGEVEQKWHVIDAADQVVGRLASRIAVLLMGKHRPTYTPHVDTCDFVVVINAEKVRFSGKKWDQKEYRWYTGYPGQRSVKAATRMERKPELILHEAVRRRRAMMRSSAEMRPVWTAAVAVLAAHSGSPASRPTTISSSDPAPTRRWPAR